MRVCTSFIYMEKSQFRAKLEGRNFRQIEGTSAVHN